MTDDVLARLGDLRDEMDRALARFESASGAVGPTTGTDESGAVTVKLDKEGSLRGVGVAADWTSRVSPTELGPAVVAAYQVAVSARLEVYAQGLDDADSGPRPTLRPAPLPNESLAAQLREVTEGAGPESTAATEAFGSFLHTVNDDIARALTALRAQRQASYTGRSPSHKVSVTVDAAGNILAVDAAPAWLARTHPTNIGREITQAAQAATETARTSSALALLSDGVLADIQRLSSDPIALAQRLGLR